MIRFRLDTDLAQSAFLDLPWSAPLGSWAPPVTTAVPAGASRHPVCFVTVDGHLFALKETSLELARHEYLVLKELRGEHLPVVEPVGVVDGRTDAGGAPLGAVLVTRFLEYALPYREVFRGPSDASRQAGLIDAAAVLLVRLHLAGVLWGDGSLNNLLFRRDAGALMAYLVDAETSEIHDPAPLRDALRCHDLDIAVDNVAGGLLDLQAEGVLPEHTDPIALARLLGERYKTLWEELNLPLDVSADRRDAIRSHTERLHRLGFEVSELEIVAGPEGMLHLRPVVIEEGYHHRRLISLVGLSAQENQARRIVADIAEYRAGLELRSGRMVPEHVAAARWVAEIYAPLLAAVPGDLRNRREPAQLFHEYLDHRYLRSVAEDRPVGDDEAVRSFVDEVLRAAHPEQRVGLAVPPTP